MKKSTKEPNGMLIVKYSNFFSYERKRARGYCFSDSQGKKS